MSLYADYVLEREGNSVLETEFGFIEYRIAPPFVRIESLFITKAERGKGRAKLLVERVTQIARDAECTHLWAQVWLGAQGSEESLKTALAMGGVMQSAQNNTIILVKEIGGENG